MNGVSTTLAAPRVLGKYAQAFQKTRDRVVAVFESPWVAYSLLLALQLKVIWKMWAIRDITHGDTSSYFKSAWDWFARGEINIAWSPIYCAFYGSLLHINPDPVWATVTHRIIIVLASGLLSLAVLRQLLPPAVAWLCAAWWAVLPIAFNTLYEVHLFAVLPSLVVWLLLLTSRGPARRAAALAVLGAAVVLVRNELSVPFAVMAAVLLVWEIRASRNTGSTRRRALLRAAGWYGVSLTASALVCLGTYQLSVVKYPRLSSHMKHKHTLNMAQVYAYGYQQRHPEWTNSPWVECEPLMQETFGNRLPTLREMIAANPKAVWEHFAWNFSMTPNGLQILMFNGTSGRANPDYIEDSLMPLNRKTPLYLSVAAGVIWTLGLVVLIRRRREWWPELGSARSLGWLAMFIVISVTPLVIATQRPRPSYLFTLAITLIAVTGAFFWLIVNRWGMGERLRQLMPVVMIALIITVPSYYKVLAKSKDKPLPPRNTAIALQRLKPYRAEIAQTDRSIIAARGEVRRYFHSDGPTKIDSLFDVLSQWKPTETLPEAMTRLKVDYFYFDEEAGHILAGTGRKRHEVGFAGDIAPAGWEIMAGDDTKPRWRLFRRAANAAPRVPSAISRFPADLGHPALVSSGIYEDGWMQQHATATLSQPGGAQQLAIRGQVLDLPQYPNYQTELVVHSDGVELIRHTLRPGEFELRVPATQAAGNHKLDFRFSHVQQLPAPDPRVVSVLLKSLAFEPKK